MDTVVLMLIVFAITFYSLGGLLVWGMIYSKVRLIWWKCLMGALAWPYVLYVGYKTYKKGNSK